MGIPTPRCLAGDLTYRRFGTVRPGGSNPWPPTKIRIQTRPRTEVFVTTRLGDAALERMTDEEVEAALTEVKGIGPWSAHGFLLVALNRPDVFLTGDIALRRVIQRIYGLARVPSEAELIEISDRWRPYRSLAVSYLFASEYEGPR
jgi:DNA-3-methyladenine glycosylase II